MSETISDLLILTGATFLLLAAVGVVRMPDLFTRMQSASKASTLGIGCVLLALAFHFPGISVNIRVVGTITFFFLTAPITAHLIGRAAYFVGVPIWKGTVVDELRGRYNPLTHRLGSDEAAADNGPAERPGQSERARSKQ
jgi:multicomponent Na+:H+ antiporter subunit G